MPGNNYAPTAALIAGADLSRWRGETLFSRGSSVIGLPNWGSPGDGLFKDVLTALNGRGEHVSFGQRADQAVKTWSAGATMTVRINDDDLVEWVCSDEFTLQAGAELIPLGFSVGSYPSVASGVSWVVTAPNNWVRGPLGLVEAKLIMDPSGTSTAVFATAHGEHQDVVTLLRASGYTPATDEDAPTFDSIQYLDNVEASIGNDETVWSLNETGHVVISCASTSSTNDITWLSDSFREWLGFTGLESEVRNFPDGYSSLTATYPHAGVIVSELEQYNPGVTRDGVAVQVGRNFYPVQRGDYPTLAISFYLRGPAACEDEQITEFHERWVPEVPQGGVVTLYQEWGDPRRALRNFRISPATVPYSRSRTSERNGERGRLICRLVPGTTSYQADWQSRVTVEARYSMALQIVED